MYSEKYVWKGCGFVSNAIYTAKYQCTCGSCKNKIIPEGGRNRVTCDVCGKFIKWMGNKELEIIQKTTLNVYEPFVPPIEPMVPIAPINTPEYPNLDNCIKYLQDYLKNEYNSNTKMVLSSDKLIYVEVIE